LLTAKKADEVEMKTSLAAAILISLTSIAYAQNSKPAPPPPDNNCAPAQPKSGENSEKPLGDKLSDSKGVLCPPPSMDSDMNVKPPDNGGKMPVIKPPASSK
jgi:hypothetical protein